MPEHSHAPQDIAQRIRNPPGRGVIKDAVYGAIDGAVTTFAIVAGVAGAGLSPFVILALGTANVLADGFSMAAANYSGTKAELDNLRRIREIEERHIQTHPEGEWLEAREILASKGLSGDILDRATDAVTRDKDNWIALMLDGEYGLGGTDPHPLHSATTTFLAFLFVGIIPLLPFALGLESAFTVSAVMTMSTFFGIGALKSLWSLSPWWKSGFESFAIGGLAAAIAYYVGALFNV